MKNPCLKLVSTFCTYTFQRKYIFFKKYNINANNEEILNTKVNPRRNTPKI